MKFFSVKDWDEIQHYKDRTPPWIKLYNHLLDDYNFSCLQDASKLHLILIWLLASRNNNKLPLNEKWIKQRIGVDSDVDLDALVDAGLIVLEPSNDVVSRSVEQDDSKTLASCQHPATTEERESRGEERERESRGEGEHSSPSAPDLTCSIFEYWRDVMGKDSTTKLTKGRKDKIKARLRDGYSENQIRQAIDGCRKSEYHMGKNDAGKKYDCLTLICRSGDKLEQFIGYNFALNHEQQREKEVDDWANGIDQYIVGETIEHE